MHSVLPYPASQPCADEIARSIQIAAAGDEAAWNHMVERYSSLLWAIARAHRLSSADAADVVQTTWLRCVEHLPAVRNPNALGAWLATTARRECLKVLRGAGRVHASPELEAVVDSRLGPAEALLLDERDTGLWKAFERLPSRDRSLLRVLMADPAPSYEEVSAALDMPIGSIGPTRGRALERLRRELRRAGMVGLGGELS
jgi:RNA polymerase sigma factor (sigma-70 family)